MSLEKVQQGLIAKLLAAFPVWNSEGRIAWENRDFTAPAAKPWMAVHFMPVNERQGTLGTAGYDLNNGLFQVSLHYPGLKGEADSRATVDALRTCFAPQAFNYDGQAVTILNRSRTGARTEDGFYKIPFTVRWRAQIKRNA